MSDARAIIDTWYASTLAGNDDRYTGHTEAEWLSLERAITAALDTERTRVWEEAATALETFTVEADSFTAMAFNDACRDLRDWCRLQGLTT